MQNKNTNRWLDVQIVIITLVMTISLFLWNFFAGGDRSTTTTAASSAPVDPPQVSSIPTPQVNVRILLGGAAPQQSSVTNNQTQVQSRPAVKAPAKAPAPVTVTGSSRP